MFFWDNCDECYNISPIAGKCIYDPSPEKRRNHSKWMKENSVWTDEMREKMRVRMSNPEHNPMSKEKYRLKISRARKVLSDEDCYKVFEEYNNSNISQHKLAEKYNVCRASIRTALRFVKRQSNN